MKIESPGGKTVDLHRRCWVGRGGSTPPGCVRIQASDLGYEGTDLEVIVPRGTGVFKAGGSLAYHHGGLSLQELVVPIVTFQLDVGKASKHAAPEDVTIDPIPTRVTNRIFSLGVSRQRTDPKPFSVIAVDAASGDTVGTAVSATDGWDPGQATVTLPPGKTVSVAIQLHSEEIADLRIRIVELKTSRVVADSEPIPVDLLS